MQAYKLILKKCEFKVKHIKYLGFIISIKGIKVNLEKVKVIRN